MTYSVRFTREAEQDLLRLFDFPDPNVTVDTRTNTTVPLQQLFVLNSEFMVRQAKAFASKLTAVTAESDSARIRHAYLLAYNRQPSEAELRLGLGLER